MLERNCGTHRNAADDKPADAAAVGKSQNIVAEIGDRELPGIAGLRPALPPAFKRQPADAWRIRKHLRHLRLVAAEPVLEDHRQAIAAVPALQHGRSALEREPAHAAAAIATVRRRKAATAGASCSVSPCVTSGPSKPTPRSRRTKSAKSMTPEPAAVKVAVGAPVLGMGHDDAIAEQIDGIGDRVDHLRRRRHLEQIGRVEHDPDAA